MSGPRPSGKLACRAGVLDGAIEVVLRAQLSGSAHGRPLDGGLSSGAGRACMQEGRACGVEPKCLDPRELVVGTLGERREIVAREALIL